MFSSFGVKPPAFGSQSYSYSSLKTHFEENGLPFWVPGVCHQCSEVVSWKLFSIQMIFWWICGGEGGLLVLFLCHLGTTPCSYAVLQNNLKRLSLRVWRLNSFQLSRMYLKGICGEVDFFFSSHLKVMTGKANRIPWVDFPGLTLILPSIGQPGSWASLCQDADPWAGEGRSISWDPRGGVRHSQGLQHN